MIRILAIVFISVCGCGPFVITNAQVARPDPSDVLKQLLAKPAPVPRLEIRAGLIKERPEDFFDKNKRPSDDAPIEDLIDYWSNWTDYPGQLPSDAVRQRLLDALIGDPKMVARFIHLFPQTESAAGRIKAVFDKMLNNQQFEDQHRERIKKWLLFNSNFFLDELLALATKVRDNNKRGDVEKRDEVVALAKVNWEVAEPLLRNLLASSQPRSAALAQTLFYQRAISQKDSALEEGYRKSLEAIASDRNQPAYARTVAIQSLSSTKWSGKDEWYLGLFHDETLFEPVDGEAAFSPLIILFASDPEKWIPIMARLVESKDLTVRSAAASCLVHFNTTNARKDALLPLLPWLSNPSWVRDRFGHRLQLIQSMESIDMPESVPGLIWNVENSSDFERSYAGAALAKYKDPRAVPALKKALTQENDGDHRKYIIAGLIACEGFTDAELLEGLEAYAQAGKEPEPETSSSEEPLSIPLAIGEHLNGLQAAPEALVQKVLDRADELKSQNLPLAQALLEIAHRWQGRQVDLDLIKRIGNGSADANTIIEALERRDVLRGSVGPELHTLSAMNGPAQGIAAALLEEPSLAQGVLGSEDQLAQVGLLACSRLTGGSLPVDLIGPLLRSKNSLLALAAKSYLLVEDSKEARDFLWKHHPNQAFVTGWAEDAEGQSRGSAIAKLEEKLRAELFKENGPVEIIGLIQSEDFNRVLRIYPDKAIYTERNDSARYHERIVSQAELSSFKQFLTTKGIADLGPQLGLCYHNCPSVEFLALTKEKGRRVFMERGFHGWLEVEERLTQFGRGEGARIRYNFEKEIPGLEILFADDHLFVKDVWQQGDEIRMFIEREETKDERKQQSKFNDSDDDDELTRAERWRQLTAHRKARFSWRVYTNKKAGAVTSQPAIYSIIDESKFPPSEGLVASSFDSDFQVQKINSDSIVIARYFNGLWKQVAGSKAVRISGEGSYSVPVVTPDGKWVVAGKKDDDGSGPNYMVRFNLQTSREFRVELEPASQFDAVAFLPLHGKVLVRRAKDSSEKSSVGPDRPEYYLLDPSTGDTRLVSGEFEPLHHLGRRFLQSTGKSDEVWAAIPDHGKNQTRVGRYNLKDFTFKPLLTLPQITFDSMSMWIDEGRKQIYLVYINQLIRLPLEATNVQE